MVLQEQMYQTARVYYGARPAVSWEHCSIFGMQKAIFEYHLRHIFKYTKIRNIGIQVPTATLIGPHDCLTIRLYMTLSRTDMCQNQTQKSFSHLQCGTVNPNGLSILCVCTMTFYMVYALSPNLLNSVVVMYISPLSLFALGLSQLRSPHFFSPQSFTQFSPASITPPVNLSSNWWPNQSF